MYDHIFKYGLQHSSGLKPHSVIYSTEIAYLMASVKIMYITAKCNNTVIITRRNGKWKIQKNEEKEQNRRQTFNSSQL